MPRKSRTNALIAALNVPGLAVTRAQIVAKFGQKAFDYSVQQNLITRLLPHVYSHPDHATTAHTKVAALGRWLLPNDALSGLAACFLYKVGAVRPRRFTVIRQATSAPRKVPKWVRMRRLQATLPTTTITGVRTVSLACALVQVWWDEGAETGKGVILDAIREGRTKGPAIAEAVAYYPRIRMRRELLAFLELLHEGVDSYLEYLADMNVLNTPDLRSLVRQRAFWIDGEKYVVDAFDEETKTAIEFDGAKYHNNDRARRRDLKKDRALATIGVLVLRFTFEDITERPSLCREQIRRVMESRRVKLSV